MSWAISLSLIGLQYSGYKYSGDSVRSWETGLTTEFGKMFFLASRRECADFAVAPAWDRVEMEEVRFTTGIHFDDQGEVYRNEYPGLNKYTGPPSPETDAAWEELIGGIN